MKSTDVSSMIFPVITNTRFYRTLNKTCRKTIVTITRGHNHSDETDTYTDTGPENKYQHNHSDETDTYTEAEPENKYHVLELSISNMTRYCLINFH